MQLNYIWKVAISYRQIDELGVPEATLAGWVGDYKKMGKIHFQEKDIKNQKMKN